INYCISKKQIEEYENILNKKIKFNLLYKMVDLNTVFQPVYQDISKKVEFKIIYAGNLEVGRDAVILKFGEALDILNKKMSDRVFSLEIYSSSLNKFPKTS